MFAAILLASIIAQQAPPFIYDAVTDRGVRTKPDLIHLGAAGFSFDDPVFGSRIWRVTDRFTRSDKTDASYRTPSGTHQNAWSADGTHFYVVSTDGTIVAFDFDPASGTATKDSALRFYIEPQFSYVDPSLIYGSVSSGSLHTIDQYDFSTGKYSQLVDLETIEPDLKGTFVGGVMSSAGPTEWVLAFFGGTSQDRHHYVLLFDRRSPSKRKLLDTQAALGFSLHHAAIDRSGRYVLLYPAAVDLAAPHNAAQVYVWDTVFGSKTPLPLTTAHSGGHDAYGYGVAVNQDCCVTTTYDATQWEFRSLGLPLAPRDLIRPVAQPREVQLADHPTWNNAARFRLVPFITATYRYGDNTVAWRAWDDEILGVQTAPGRGAQVYRFAHHRSDVRDDDHPAQIGFWYTPRPNVSQDGRWVLFTSNWEKTLGSDPTGPAGSKARQDVFLLHITGLPDARDR